MTSTRIKLKPAESNSDSPIILETGFGLSLPMRCDHGVLLVNDCSECRDAAELLRFMARAL